MSDKASMLVIDRLKLDTLAQPQREMTTLSWGSIFMKDSVMRATRVDSNAVHHVDGERD